MGPSDARARPIARGAVADGQGAASDDDGADSALSVGLDGQEDLLIGALERTPEGASKADDPHEYFCVVCSNGGSLVRGARSPERPLRERVFSPPRCSPSRRRCGGTPTQTRGFSSAWASSACLPRMRTGRAAVRAPKKGLQAAVSRGGKAPAPLAAGASPRARAVRASAQWLARARAAATGAVAPSAAAQESGTPALCVPHSKRLCAAGAQARGLAAGRCSARWLRSRSTLATHFDRPRASPAAPPRYRATIGLQSPIVVRNKRINSGLRAILW